MAKPQRQAMTVWLLDDDLGRITGAHLSLQGKLHTANAWKTLAKQIGELFGDVDCGSGTTDGIYIFSIAAEEPTATKLLITRIFDAPVDSSMTFPKNTVAMLALNTLHKATLGVMSVANSAPGCSKDETLLFGIPKTHNRSAVRIDSSTQASLLALGEGMHSRLQQEV